MIVELILVGILLFMVGSIMVGRLVMGSKIKRLTDEQFRNWFARHYLGMSSPEEQLQRPAEQSQSERRRASRSRQVRPAEQNPISEG
jgi:hypothetical protein